MATLTPVAVPDVGDFADIPIIEILVAVGDTVAVDDPLVTLESDKATMDIPAPAAGKVAARARGRGPARRWRAGAGGNPTGWCGFGHG